MIANEAIQPVHRDWTALSQMLLAMMKWSSFETSRNVLRLLEPERSYVQARMTILVLKKANLR
jgi:hypothetical protein